MKISNYILFVFLFPLILSAQFDSRKFTYNEGNDKNYINYEQLEELTTKMLESNPSYYNEDDVQKFINIDPATLPKYTDEELHNRILAIPTTIPLKFTPQVGEMIRYFTTKRREYVTRMLTMSKVYFPIYEEIFDEADIPLELKCLSIVESALNPLAKSRVGATGLWQFMHGTARHEGMEINTLYDARSDVYVSTEHAAKFLKKLHNLYGDWFLALASYNAGPGNVNKAIKYSGGYDFWTIKHKLPRETQNYVPSFIAMVYIMHYHKDYFLYPGKPKIDFKNTVVEIVKEKQSTKYIAELVGTSEDIIKQYNPCLKKGIIPKVENGYHLILPKQYAYTLNEKKDLLAIDPYIYNPAFVPAQPNVIENTDSILQESARQSELAKNEEIMKVREMTKEVVKEIEANVSKEINNSSPVEASEVQTTDANQIVTFESFESKQTDSSIPSNENITIKDETTLSNNVDNYSTKIDEVSTNYSITDSLPIVKNTNDVLASNDQEIVATDTVNVSKAYLMAIKKEEEQKQLKKYKIVKVEEVHNKLKTHKVSKGESLIEIAKMYGVSVNKILEWNPRVDKKNLQLGANLKINIQEKIVKPQYETVASQNNDENRIVHKVKKGENLYQLSKLYNVSLEELKEWNNLGEENIQIGKEIIINNGAAKTKTLLGDYFYHVSKGGDTLQSASNMYKVPVETLKKLNNKAEDEPLQAGEKIKIPSL